MMGAGCPVPPLETDAQLLPDCIPSTDFVISPLAVRSFISAVIVIADSVIAVRLAARNPAANNAVRPTAVISKARRGGSIIGITSVTTANGRLKPA
jgi:hypothetical protein